MTLNVTTSQIQIKNSAGVVKFTSDNKLIYKKYSQTGTLTVDSGLVVVPFYRLKAGEFLVINLKINSCNGDARVTASLINNILPANNGIVIDFYGRAESQVASVDTEVLGVSLVDNSLLFKSIRYGYLGDVSNGIKSTNLTYYAYVMSYL